VKITLLFCELCQQIFSEPVTSASKEVTDPIFRVQYGDRTSLRNLCVCLSEEKP
jgi:hypothetical protein